ncbi:MAG TPA: C39 family peptidase [Gaiellaceae bacterium]|nr:C39 family peptidase [Gaiellaceae bacterium]
MIRRALITVFAAAAFGLVGTAPAMAAQPYPLNFKTFGLDAPDATSGVVYSDAGVTLASSGLGGPYFYSDPFADYSGDGADGTGNYVYGTWTSPVTTLGFGFNELVSSWNATTPPNTWIQVEMQPLIDGKGWAKWYILGRWASDDPHPSTFHRTSVGGQGDANGFVSIDTFFAKDHLALAYRLRVTLFRSTTTTQSPTLTRLSAIAMNLTNQKGSFPSPTTMAGTGIDLGVPGYSQEIHHGDFPQYDNGGEAWCSPTSTSMVVSYWSNVTGTNYDPTTTDYDWVTAALGANHPDPWVDYAARQVYDYHYNGAGNWPFNVAYAASRGLMGEVTALHSLREAEPFIRLGIPLVASVAWNSNKLDGGIKSTNGHLMVIGGFTGNGDVIAYDPASSDDTAVRHVYDREQFERAWIPASGGIVYSIRPVGYQTKAVEDLLTANNS